MNLSPYSASHENRIIFKYENPSQNQFGLIFKNEFLSVLKLGFYFDISIVVSVDFKLIPCRDEEKSVLTVSEEESN